MKFRLFGNGRGWVLDLGAETGFDRNIWCAATAIPKEPKFIESRFLPSLFIAENREQRSAFARMKMRN
jgi:hypothetical protein